MDKISQAEVQNKVESKKLKSKKDINTFITYGTNHKPLVVLI